MDPEQQPTRRPLATSDAYVLRMALMTLPPVLAGLSQRIGHDDAVRNARRELDLAERRIDDAEDLIRRVEAHTRAPSPSSRPAPRRRHAA